MPRQAAGTTLLDGKYRLEAQIGVGGMGVVWRAVHTTLKSPVAVKFVTVRGPRAEEAAQRFLREAQLAASVRSRMVVDILDFGQTDDGQPFMIMELLEGETLAERMVRDPPLTTNEVVDVFERVLRGLQAVHDAGIVHRDLKPENIHLLEDADGYFPKLTDFGISRTRKTSVPPTPGVRSKAISSEDGIVVGTPEYMSPEQARGLKDVDRRTDIYSVGVMLYEILTGRLPFEADAVGDLLIAIIMKEPQPAEMAGVHESLAMVIERAMSKNRQHRYESATEMRQALLEARDDVSRVDVPVVVGLTHRPMPTSVDDLADAMRRARLETQVVDLPRKRMTGWWLAVLLALGAMGAGLVALSRASEGEPPSEATIAPPEEPPVAPPEPVTEEPIPSPAPALAPEPEPPVTVTLNDVPEDAEIRVDDEVVEDAPLSFERDGATHTIAVTAEGYEPWQTEFVADHDADFDVELDRARHRARPRPSMESRMSTIVRELDF